MIKKTIFSLLLLSQTLFCATPQQVEQYISVSNSEGQLIALESQFSQMQSSINNFKAKEDKEVETYDMQLLSIRFREYIEKNISEDEMNEVLKQYKNVILLKFVSVQNDSEYNEEEAKLYMEKLKTEDNASIRLDLLDDVSSQLYKKENIGILFDNLMLPLLTNSKNAKNVDKQLVKKTKEAYIKRMTESGKIETAYSTKEFTIEELEDLLGIVNRPSIDHESEVVFAATAYALKEFFLSIANRYDASKH